MMKEMKETIKKVIREYAPDWENNNEFILNVATLYSECTADDYDDDENAEMIDGYYKDAIEDAINMSINDYEEGLTVF